MKHRPLSIVQEESPELAIHHSPHWNAGAVDF
jgi:hypothetical protein